MLPCWSPPRRNIRSSCPPSWNRSTNTFLKDCAGGSHHPHEPAGESERSRTLFIPHHPWPGVTIHKFHYLCQYANELSEFDYLFMCDADMRVVAPVGREILGDLVATRHSHFYNKHLPPITSTNATRLRRPTSRPAQGSAYVNGRISSAAVMPTCLKWRRIAARPSTRTMPTSWKRSGTTRAISTATFYDHPSTLLLSPSYCYPEGKNLPFEPKILALEQGSRCHPVTSGLEDLDKCMARGWLSALCARHGSCWASKAKPKGFVRKSARLLAAMIISVLQGGFGNQMFQYAAGRVVAARAQGSAAPRTIS